MTPANTSATVVNGIKVDVSVSIENALSLGIEVANLESFDQAQFLLGLANGFNGFPDPGSMSLQIRALTEDVKRFAPSGRLLIKRFVETLAEHISEVQP